MNCPSCNFHFAVLAMNAPLPVPELAPILCEACAAVAIVERGAIRRATADELADIQQSPAWGLLAPAIRLVESKKSWPTRIPVTVYRDDGTKFNTFTRSVPWLLGGHTWVVLVDGIAGAYRLDRVVHREREETYAR